MNDIWYRWLDWLSNYLGLILVASVLLLVALIAIILLFSKEKEHIARRKKKKKEDANDLIQVEAMLRTTRQNVEQLLGQYAYQIAQQEAELERKKEEARQMDRHIAHLLDEISILENLPPELASQIHKKKQYVNYQMLSLGIFIGLLVAILGGAAYVYAPQLGFW